MIKTSCYEFILLIKRSLIIFVVKSIIVLNCLLCFGCSNKDNDISVHNTKPDDAEGLEFWTADTVLYSNTELVHLMDTLYRYTRADFPADNIDNDIKWMDKYRQQLCDYYKRVHPGNNISSFSMADSVLREARELWALDADESTMGMIVNNSVEETRLIFEQFNAYSKLLSVCKNESQRKLLKDEFEAWIKMEQIFSAFYSDCVDLEFWGGSISGPIRTAGILSIWQSHIDLYQKEYTILATDDGWKDSGTFVIPARKLLLECCNEAIINYYCSECEDKNDSYEECYEETNQTINQLPRYIDDWINKRKPWEEEMCTDWLRPAYSRNTAEVLIKMANIISSVR